MILKGEHVIKITGIVSTDDILPAIYKHSSIDPSDYKTHIFENKFPKLCSGFRNNTIIVNDSIFGIGSSREQSVTALKAAGVIAIIAPQFGRIFFRNAWNLSLPCFELAASGIQEGEKVTIDFDQSKIIIGTSEQFFPSIPRIMIEICLAGGLLSFYKNSKGHESRFI